MKNRNGMYFLFICLLFVTVFFSADVVYALPKGCSSVNDKNTVVITHNVADGETGNHRVKYCDGNPDQFYCADQIYVDPEKDQVFKKYDLKNFFKTYSMGEHGPLEESKIDSLINKLGAAKYYFENEASSTKLSDYSKALKIRFTQVALWKIIVEYYDEQYGNVFAGYCDDVTVCYIGDGNRPAFNEMWAAFGTWFSTEGQYVTVEGSAWRRDDGGGQPLIKLNEEYIPPVVADFGIDAACTGCDSKNADSKAYVLQDTDNWEAILNSDSSSVGKFCDNNNIKTYFKREDGVYCREEYHVYFPNAKNKIEIELGRYFIVNEDRVPAVANDIPIWKPIKVTKIRQCKGDNAKLQAFKTKSNSDFFRCGGKVKLTYKNAKPYDREFTLTSHYTSGRSEISGDMLTQEATYSYRLPSNVYRFVRIEDGISIVGAPSDAEKGKYRDLTISNLPIPFKDSGADIQAKLSYALPAAGVPASINSSTCYDTYSTFKKSFTIENNTAKDNLKCSGNVKNDKKENGPYINNETPWTTACAKLYNVTQSEFNSGGVYLGKLRKDGKRTLNQDYITCVSERTGQSNIGNCLNTNNDYLCTFDETCKCNKTTAGKKIGSCDFTGYTWDSTLRKCVKPNTPCSKNGEHYYGKDGKETSKEEYVKVCCDSPEKAKDLGVDWDSYNKVCCEENKIYSDSDHKCCSINEYNPETGQCHGKPSICTKDNVGDFPGMEFIGGTCCAKTSIITVKGKKACCTSSNYKDFNLDWNPVNQVCCSEGTKFNTRTQKCEPDDAKICGGLKCEAEGKPCCENGGSYYCGWVTPEGKQVCSGKPSFAELIYREINPVAAFVNENGGSRSRTGLNWCNAVTVVGDDKLTGANCSTDSENNPVIKKVIAEGNTLDKENASYVVKLDAQAIDEIRTYNKTHDYSDFELKCAKGFCYSDFLKKYGKYVSGKCKLANSASSYDKFATCGVGGGN